MEVFPVNPGLKKKAVDGASGYYIYRNGKMIKKTVKVSTTEYTDTIKAVNGAKYIYKIKAYANTGVSTLYNETTIYYLTTPKAPALTVTKDGNIKVSWKKNSKCDGYIIRYSRNKGFSTYETAVVNSSSTLTEAPAAACLPL